MAHFVQYKHNRMGRDESIKARPKDEKAWSKMQKAKKHEILERTGSWRIDEKSKLGDMGSSGEDTITGAVRAHEKDKYLKRVKSKMK